MNTLDVLAIIEGNNKEIDSFSFHSFPQQKLVQEQVVEWGELDQKHFDLAMDVRNELHLPFGMLLWLQHLIILVIHNRY